MNNQSSSSSASEGRVDSYSNLVSAATGAINKVIIDDSPTPTPPPRRRKNVRFAEGCSTATVSLLRNESTSDGEHDLILPAVTAIVPSGHYTDEAEERELNVVSHIVVKATRN